MDEVKMNHSFVIACLNTMMDGGTVCCDCVVNAAAAVGWFSLCSSEKRDFHLDVVLQIGIECLTKCTVELVREMVIVILIRQMVFEVDVL